MAQYNDILHQCNILNYEICLSLAFVTYCNIAVQQAISSPGNLVTEVTTTDQLTHFIFTRDISHRSYHCHLLQMTFNYTYYYYAQACTEFPQGKVNGFIGQPITVERLLIILNMSNIHAKAGDAVSRCRCFRSPFCTNFALVCSHL